MPGNQRFEQILKLIEIWHNLSKNAWKLEISCPIQPLLNSNFEFRRFNEKLDKTWYKIDIYFISETKMDDDEWDGPWLMIMNTK